MKMQKINDCGELSNNLYVYNTISIPQNRRPLEKEPEAQDTRDIMSPTHSMATKTMKSQQHGEQKLHILTIYVASQYGRRKFDSLIF